MLATADIHRSLGSLSINIHKATEARTHRADEYILREREFQAQYEFNGQLGTLPSEAQLTVGFNLSFVADPGSQRDGTLDRPIFRPGFEKEYGPGGMVPYAVLENWVLDDDFNFVGMVVTLGVHFPLLLVNPTFADSLAFKFITHLTVQGFCVVWDPEGPFDAGGNQDDPGATP